MQCQCWAKDVTPGSLCVFLEASHHAGILMTLLERKDLEYKMTCGERGHGRSNKASGVMVTLSWTFQPSWGSDLSCHLTAQIPSEASWRTLQVSRANPQKTMSATTWLLLRPPSHLLPHLPLHPVGSHLADLLSHPCLSSCCCEPL